MKEKNLSTKKLTEFTSEDTIYIRNMASDRKELLLCQFVKYDKEKAIVHGTVICEPSNPRYNPNAEKPIKARYSNCALYGNAADEEGRSYFRFFDASLYAMHPLEKHKVIDNDVHVSEHPSYAMARFSRIIGGYRSLFGSSIQSQQTITLTISKASHDRNYSNDYFHSNKEIIEIEMSSNQFSELITSFNMGSGVPVTIRTMNHERYPDVPFVSKSDLFQEEFDKKMQNFTVDIRKIVEQSADILENKASIGKGDRDIIAKSIDALVNHISSTIPFISKQFSESMDKVVIEAKSDIEAFVENKIRNTGLEALGYSKENNLPLLESPNTQNLIEP